MLRFLRISLLLISLTANGQPFQTVLVAPNTDSYEAGFALAPMGVAAGQTTSFPAAGAGSPIGVGLAGVAVPAESGTCSGAGGGGVVCECC